MIFSFGPKMIKSFGISEVDAGLCMGYIGSSGYVGWIISCYATGYMADNKGHKLVLMFTMVGMIMFTLLFGFSTSFYWALSARFGQGLCMSSVGICKSILTLACDETNITQAFSIFYTCWTMAFIVGPSIAGFLVFPSHQYPEVFGADSVFAKFGILLPNLILAVCLAITMVLALLFLPTCHPVKQMCPDGDDDRCSLLADDSVKTKEYSTIPERSDDVQHDSPLGVCEGKIFGRWCHIDFI